MMASAKKSVYPLDVWGIKKIGVDSWYNEPSWPLPEGEWLRYCQDMFAQYAEALVSLKEPHRGILLAAYKVHSQMMQFVHMLWLYR